VYETASRSCVTVFCLRVQSGQLVISFDEVLIRRVDGKTSGVIAILVLVVCSLTTFLLSHRVRGMS
jgi:hypothetical protein